jgi:cytochrome c biogenesis protein CcmG/thiol:disulfide interchange protein DsbE
MRKRTWPGVIVLAVAVAFAASGVDGPSAGAASVETAPVSVQGAPLPPYKGPTTTDRAIGDTIPTLMGKGFDGLAVTIAPTGKPRVVLFVAHWCPHCQREVPLIVKLAKQKAFKGIAVSTVATGTNPGYPNYPPSAWLKREHWPFPVMVDSQQYTAATAYGLPSYPYFVFVDAQGKVAGRGSGETPPSSLKKILTALAAGKPLPLGSSSS